MSERLTSERALEVLAYSIRENPEVYSEFNRDERVQSVEVRLHQNDFLN
jgi:hypothetical protein